METLEGNVLIAKFDRWVFLAATNTRKAMWVSPVNSWEGEEAPMFEHYMELLMPVVEKISSVIIHDEYVRVEIVPGGYVKIENLRDTPIFTNVSKEGSLIAAIWKAVVQFIQWFNQQSK